MIAWALYGYFSSHRELHANLSWIRRVPGYQKSLSHAFLPLQQELISSTECPAAYSPCQHHPRCRSCAPGSRPPMRKRTPVLPCANCKALHNHACSEYTQARHHTPDHSMDFSVGDTRWNSLLH